MENEVKQRNQRNRRRERAQRMQAQRESKVKDGDSGEDESPAREKPPRPPARRKRSKEPLGEEDIIDGFAIMAFKTYEDLEAAVKAASSPRTNALSTKPLNVPRSVPTHTVGSITLLQDAGTSDDSGRASERLTGSSVAPRDPDSSRDRLSDASSRCSSGKGYICDSEGDDDKASPENSRNVSPRYHDASMEDVSDANALFRAAGAGAAAAAAGAGAGGKSELVARGGSGGALALSRAPVGGSASPAPAPLPQPAPSPAPAALPPPALPPPTFRADTPHRNNGAHIPALDGHAATQIPARPVGAAGADTPERPASNNKLQPGARAAADSPTPAPPAPPAPSPLFPSPHTAYQAHAAAAALPDYRHTNHETRTDRPDAPPAPLDLHSARPPLLSANAAQALASLPKGTPHSHPHPVAAGQDVRPPPGAAAAHPSTPTSFPSRVNGAPAAAGAGPLAPPANPSCLPSQPLPGRPVSPAASSRPYPAPPIGSSHVNSSISSSIHNHAIPYQSQSSLQKHSLQSVYASRPSHLAPFSVPNHISANHIQTSTTSPTTATNTSHPINSHSMMNHASHLPIPPSNSTSLASTPNHIGPPPPLSSTTTSGMPSFTPSLKHGGVNLLHPAPIGPPLHAPAINHIDAPASSAPSTLTPTSNSSSHPSSHILPPPVVDSRQPPTVDSRQSLPVDSRRPPSADSRRTPVSSSELPVRSENAVVTSMAMASNGYPPPAVYAGAAYPPLYAPYATTLQHSPYLPAAAASPRNTTDTRTSLSSSPLVAPKTPKGVRPHTPGSTGAAGAPHAPLSYSPRGHSPTRERESFSSNISSLSRSTPASATSAPAVSMPAPAPAPASSLPAPAPAAAPLPAPLAAPLAAPLVPPLVPPICAPLATPTPTAPTPAPTHLTHSLAPVPTVPSISSGTKPPAHWGVTRPTAPDRPAGFAPAPPLFGAPLAPNPNPFSAESLFQTSPGADLLRRELDNRFLAAAGAAGAVGAPGGVPVPGRTELHHHQHQHTHVHQHPHHTPPAPHPPHSAHPAHPAHTAHPAAPPGHHHQLLMPHAPLFKDVGKIPSLYRTGLGLGYPYSSSLLHPAAPYVPPAPLSSYAPKPVVSAASDPQAKPPTPRTNNMKTGKWNAMHVRIAWEIYNHQQKEKTGAVSSAGGVAVSVASAVPSMAHMDKDKLRAFPAPAPPPAPPPPYRSPYDLPPAPYLPHHPHLGQHFSVNFSGMSPFARYGAGPYPGAPTAFGLSPYGRDLALSSTLHGVHHPPLGLHDAWRVRPQAPPSAAAVEASRREHEERERARRDREERERRDREERERRKQRERELERVRTRSPLRNGVPEPIKEERKEQPRPPPSALGMGMGVGVGVGVGGYGPPPAPWDPYRAAFDPLQHMRFAPLVEAAIRAEEDRAKMLSAYAHHQQLKAAPLLHRGLPPSHAPLPPLAPHAHAPLAPLPPLAPHAPPLAPLAPLDLLKKEEPR